MNGHRHLTNRARSRSSWARCLALGVLAGTLASGAVAQCGREWSDRFGPPGVSGSVTATAVFDDGTGPALYAGGSYYAAGGNPAGNIARWNGRSWAPVGGGVDGAVTALKVWDDGSGPALYAGGSFTLAGGVAVNGIAKWDGVVWQALSSGLGGPVPAGWSPQVRALTIFDDGTGPTLVAGGLFGSAGGVLTGNMALWDGFSWASPGGGTNGMVLSLEVYSDAAGPALYAGGDFTTAGGSPIPYLARWNSTSWSGVGAALDAVVSALAVHDDGGGTALFAGGWFTSAGGLALNRIARFDGVGWSALGAGMDERVHALAIHDDGNGARLHAGGYFSQAGGIAASTIAQWDGTAWSALGAGTSGPVQSLAVFDDGAGPALYAGGLFGAAGGRCVLSIARWRNQAWSPLGSGTGDVACLAVFDDGTGPALVAGGPVVFQCLCLGVIRWTGSDWSRIGGIFECLASLRALAVTDLGAGPALFAGGTFLTYGATTVNGITRWTGSTWVPLGTGVSGPVSPGSVIALSSFDAGSGPRLYAGGEFTTAGGVPASRIASWDGTGWSAVGTGIGTGTQAPAVNCLAVFDDGTGPALYAGGTFQTAGGVFVSRIARWNGLSWSALGAGVNGPVMSLAPYDDGSGPALFAGGSFTAAGGQNAPGIARWTAAGWSVPGGGIAGPVLGGLYVGAMTTFDDGRGPALYAGGRFQSAGGIPAASIARWDGSAWSALDTGITGYNSTVTALTAFDDGSGPALWVGGSFLSAGPRASRGIARWSASSPRLTLSQPGGPGTGVFASNRGLRISHEYFNVFSGDPCPLGPGAGPYLGLCTSNPDLLVAQILAPLGAAPFHFLAPSDAIDFGPYLLPAGLVIEGICLDLTGGLLGCFSSVVRFTVQ